MTTTTPSGACDHCGCPLELLDRRAPDGDAKDSARRLLLWDLLRSRQEASLDAAVEHAATLTPAQLARVLSTADVVEAWLAAVRTEALQRAQRGVEIPGYKLVQQVGERKWIDETNAAKVLRQCGIADPLEHTIISPAQAEKKNRALKDITPKMTVRAPGKASLVPTDCPTEVEVQR